MMIITHNVLHHHQTCFYLCLFLSEFYEPGALMMEEEGVVMGGLLVGLNVIDANLCIKGEDLDSQVSPGGIDRLTCQIELRVNCFSPHI